MGRVLEMPTALRAGTVGRPVGVDRDRRVILGYVVAQRGPFKTGRGEFDEDALREIVKLGNDAPKGLRSRFTHPNECNDGLGSYLGRAVNFTMSTATNASGEKVPAVRADLKLSPSAFKSPKGSIGEYILELVAEDADALSSSLVLRVKEEYRIDKAGRPLKDADGRELPPLWRPTKLMASDLVDTGDAVDGLLSADSPAALAARYLDELTAGASAEVVRARCLSWLDTYLQNRYGAQTQPAARPKLAALGADLAALRLTAAALGATMGK